MGVPPKLNQKWLKSMEDGKRNGNVREVTTRSAHIPYNANSDKFTMDLVTTSHNMFEIDVELLYFNKYSGRLGAWAAPNGDANKLDQNLDRDFKVIKNHNLVTPQITLERSKKFQKRLKHEGQMEVCIAQADGVLIDGNRRFANLLEIKQKTVFVHMLPESISTETLEEMEGYYSFTEDTRIPYSTYLRAVQIYSQIEPRLPKSISDECFKKEAEKALDKKTSFLSAAQLPKQKAVELVIALREGREWCKNNGYGTDTDVLEDVKKTSAGETPGFDIFLTRVPALLKKARGVTTAEKRKDKMYIRKLIYAATKPHGGGRGADKLDDIGNMLRDVRKKDEFYKQTKVLKSPNGWKTKGAWDEIERNIALVRVTSASTKILSKMKTADKALQNIKLSEIKRENKKEIKPFVKKMSSKLKSISSKVNQ